LLVSVAYINEFSSADSHPLESHTNSPDDPGQRNSLTRRLVWLTVKLTSLADEDVSTAGRQRACVATERKWEELAEIRAGRLAERRPRETLANI